MEFLNLTINILVYKFLPYLIPDFHLLNNQNFQFLKTGAGEIQEI